MGRKYDPEKLKLAAADWDIHHALVAAVRRLVRLSGGARKQKTSSTPSPRRTLWKKKTSRSSSVPYSPTKSLKVKSIHKPPLRPILGSGSSSAENPGCWTKHRVKDATPCIGAPYTITP